MHQKTKLIFRHFGFLKTIFVSFDCFYLRYLTIKPPFCKNLTLITNILKLFKETRPGHRAQFVSLTSGQGESKRPIVS